MAAFTFWSTYFKIPTFVFWQLLFIEVDVSRVSMQSFYQVLCLLHLHKLSVSVKCWSQCILHFPLCFLLKGLGKYGVLFYNALIIIVPTVLASAYTGDLHKVLAGYVRMFYLSVVWFPFSQPPCMFWPTGSCIWGLGRSYIYRLFPHVVLHGVRHCNSVHTVQFSNSKILYFPQCFNTLFQICADVFHSSVQLL